MLQLLRAKEFPLHDINAVCTGVRICGNARTNHRLHILWGLVFAAAGIVQVVAGIYFMLNLPIFQIGSNIWTGAWVRESVEKYTSFVRSWREPSICRTSSVRWSHLRCAARGAV